MSSDDIEFERSGDGDTGDVFQDNADETIKDDDLSMTTTATTTTTSQQALKQLNQLTSNNSNSSGTKVTAATVASTSAVGASNLQKIEPKLTIPGAKIVYIKNPNGTQQSIRIGGSLIGGNQSVSANNSNSNANATSSTIQKVQLLQLKNKNVVSSSAVPTAAATSANNSQPRFVLKPGCAPPARFIISSSSGAAAKISPAGTSGPNTRTITVQQMGLIVPSNKTTGATTSTSSSSNTKTPILPASTSSSISASSSAGGANIALKNQPTILNKGVKPIQSPQKILIQSDSGGDGGESKTKSPGAPNIVKVAGTGQQVRVLQGKGLQYVRVLNAIPSGNANTSTATATSKIVNGRQQQVIVQRKLVPQQGGTQMSTAGGKPQQFVTKKLEVMPIGSTTKIIKKDSNTGQAVKTPTTFLLNNVQKNIVTSSIDIKPVTSNQSDSFEITEVKDEPSSPSNTLKKFTSRTYSLSTDRKSKSPEPNQSNLMYSTLKLPSPEPIEGIRRKHCNCTKSQCLKLYCDCFANGEFCSNCNCKECFNTLEKEDERQKAIKICLERNPHAFKPKIGKARDQSDTLRRHTKGCNCKRSGCLKNYCECYEAKIVCSANCKCIGCRNIDDHMDNNDRDNSHYEVNQTIKRTYEQRDEKIKTEPVVPAKKPCNFITPDVIEATVQCIIAQADDCLKNECDAKASERKILEEFGRCLVEIIEFSKKNNENVDE